MPPINLGWLILISLIPFIIRLDTIASIKDLKPRLIKAFIQGSLFGFIFMGFSNLWIFELIRYSGWLQITCLYFIFTIMQSLFYSFLATIYCGFRFSITMFPFLWIIFEWFRASGLFASTHYNLAYSQALNGVFLQYASVGGLYLVSFLCVFVNVGIIIWVRNNRHFFSTKKNYRHFTLPLILVFLIIGNHLLTLSPQLDPPTTPLKIGLFQPNHAQLDKQNKRKRFTLIRDYVHAVQEKLDQEKLDLIMFPETIIPRALDNQLFMMALNNFTTSANTSFLFGSSRKPDQHIFNSVVLVDSENNISTYNKVNLMPFGEYWPYKKVFKFFSLNNLIPSTEYRAGDLIHPISFGSYELGVGICLELMYPDFFNTQTKKGADILISLANSAWFHDSWISKALFEMAILRAVENGRYVIQVSNIGISGIVSPDGHIVVSSELNKPSFLSESLTVYTKHTIYSLYGDWFVRLSFLIILIVGLFISINRLKNSILTVKTHYM